MERYGWKISAVKPKDWSVKESITLLASDGQANVIASSEPLDPSIDTKRYATVQGDLLSKEFPGYREKAFEQRPVFGGHDGYLREFEWTPPDGQPVTQVQLYCVVASQGYTATVTTPTSQWGRLELLLRQLLDGLAVDSA